MTLHLHYILYINQSKFQFNHRYQVGQKLHKENWQNLQNYRGNLHNVARQDCFFLQSRFIYFFFIMRFLYLSFRFISQHQVIKKRLKVFHSMV